MARGRAGIWTSYDIVGLGVLETRCVLEAGQITSVDLVAAYLNRIACFDRTGPCLHAIAVLNPDSLDDVAASGAFRVAIEKGETFREVTVTVEDGADAVQACSPGGSRCGVDACSTRSWWWSSAGAPSRSTA